MNPNTTKTSNTLLRHQFRAALTLLVSALALSLAMLGTHDVLAAGKGKTETNSATKQAETKDKAETESKTQTEGQTEPKPETESNTKSGSKSEGASDTASDGGPKIDIPELPEVKLDIPVSGVSGANGKEPASGASSSSSSGTSTDSSSNDPSTDSSATDSTSTEPSADATSTATKDEKPKLTGPAAKPKPAGFDAGKKLFDVKKYYQAQKVFEKFVSNGTADVNTHAYLAVCYFKQHIYSRAQAENEWVAKYAPGEGLRRSASNTAAALRSARSGNCTGGCLKANDSRWRYLPGYSRDKKWISFSAGQGTVSFSTGHIGEVIKTVNGVPTSMGPCPKCGGAGYLSPLKDGMLSPW